MISKKIQDAINDQINEELYSAYLYLALAAHYHAFNLKGIGTWLEAQAKEEIEHAMKFYNFMIARAGTVSLKTIKQPPTQLPPANKAFRLAYEHEQYITEKINQLYELAHAQKDYAFEELLHWFIKEQVEEEASTLEIAERLDQIGNQTHALYMLDAKLGKRNGGQ
ncbi:MAG: ferritin [Patescibacteria group bacterium]|nr:ferritin [Patescibacteria group bacterium]MDD5715736.1 ferritin [Patescibacteria group bacterium]